jgi:hypothetical protein
MALMRTGVLVSQASIQECNGEQNRLLPQRAVVSDYLSGCGESCSGSLLSGILKVTLWSRKKTLIMRLKRSLRRESDKRTICGHG